MEGGTSEVAIVGAGVIGCALAWELAGRGLRVTVLERATPGSGASVGAGGMLAPQMEAEAPGPSLALGLEARACWAAWAQALPMSVDLDLTGILRVAVDGASLSELGARADWQRAIGLTARLCDPSEVADLCPGLAGAVGGLWVPDGQLSAPRLMHALTQGMAQRGVRLRCGVGVVGIRPGRVETDQGAFSAEVVVVAAGAWSGALAGVPVVPAKGQRLLLAQVERPLALTVWGPGAYLVPKAGGQVLLGATQEPEAGFDTRVTAGAVARLTAAAAVFWPVAATATLQEVWAGLRPMAPDHHPLVGPLPDMPGVWLASGHGRNGILLAALTAERLADALCAGRALPEAWDPRRPACRVAPAG